MFYNGYQYKQFMQLVSDKRYFITEVELRETKTTYETHTVMSTDKAYFYPELDHDTTYEIAIEYVNAEQLHRDGTPEYLSEAFCFERETTTQETKDTAIRVYNELVKFRMKRR